MVELIDVEPLASGQPAAQRSAGWLAQLSWALYDGSRSPYNVLINIFVFSAYFSTVVIPDSVRGQATWSFMTSIAGALVAVGAPILGAVADAGGRRKPWLAACVIIGAPCMMMTWAAVPGMTHGMGWVMAAMIVAYVTFEYSAIFCNAMLPSLAPARRLGFLSGLGFSLGNAFGILLFLVFLFAWSWNPHPLFGLDKASHQPERAVGFIAAGWFALFAIPLFLFTPDAAPTRRRPVEAVRHGISTLIGTLRKLGDYKNVATFLISRMSYNEGFIVMMLFTGVFAAGILHWTAAMLSLEGLINSVVAALAALFAGWLDTRIGSKRATMAFVAVCLLSNVIILSVTPTMVFFTPIAADAMRTGGPFPTLPDKVFLITQAAIAFSVTGGLVTSRSMMAKLAPRDMLNEFFGLYAMSGTATSFVGPLAIGLMTTLLHSQRAGVAVGVVFLLAGLLLMLKVREQLPAKA